MKPNQCFSEYVPIIIFILVSGLELISAHQPPESSSIPCYDASKRAQVPQIEILAIYYS